MTNSRQQNFHSIGIFDSGVGGLSVLRAISSLLPNNALIYFGDQSHVPYGTRPSEEILKFSCEITRFLLSKDVKIIVVACNTASAVSLVQLRKLFPETPFVGMEPAIKPAAENTKSGVVGVLATPATFHGGLYASVVERFAENVTLLESTCPGLVQQIEQGDLETQKTRAILESALLPMMDKGIDTVVLGCTHYPFVIPLIREIVGSGVRVIDPAPAVARQVERVLVLQGTRAIKDIRALPLLYTSGKITSFKKVLPKLVNQECIVRQVRWEDGTIYI